MTIALKKSETSPPAPTARAIRQHRKALLAALDACKASAPALALDAALGAFGASDALTNLCSKITAIEFELSLHDRVLALGMQQDQAAESAWRSAEQTMDVEEVIEGLSKGGCCTRCTPGVHCVITAPDKNSGGTCGHPLLSQHLQFQDEFGKKHFRYEGNPRAAEIYRAACKKLKVSPGVNFLTERKVSYGRHLITDAS